jgi:DNA-binding beta-propeller fold protein YncE
LRRWLDVPDGVTVSGDGRWLALSNHHRHGVLMYDRSYGVDEQSNPIAILRGVLYPHGLCFTPDGEHLLVADGGTPYVHVFSRTDELWTGVRYPSASVRVKDDANFQAARTGPDEGGPKGIDLDGSGRVLAVTSEHQTLAFFDASQMIERAEAPLPDRSLRVSYELDVMRANDERLAASSGVAAAFKRTNLYRVSRPLRRRVHRARRALRSRRS